MVAKINQLRVDAYKNAILEHRGDRKKAAESIGLPSATKYRYDKLLDDSGALDEIKTDTRVAFLEHKLRETERTLEKARRELVGREYDVELEGVILEELQNRTAPEWCIDKSKVKAHRPGVATLFASDWHAGGKS